MAAKILRLTDDKDIVFPNFTLLTASAGSGKTHTLTKRFVQFLVSEKIERNSLNNILSITFSNNAAKEMKERILRWLKSIYFKDSDVIEELSRITSMDKDKLGYKAEKLIDEIFEHYTDFQVKTIDSFMTGIFKSYAVDIGYNSDFDILISSENLMKYAFELFLKRVKKGTGEAGLLERVTAIIHENKKRDSSYLWDPSKIIFNEIKNIYKKLASTGKDVRLKDYSQEINDTKDRILDRVKKIEDMIERSGLLRNKSSSYNSILTAVKTKRFSDLIGKGFKKPPVNKPKRDNAAGLEWYTQILEQWDDLSDSIRQYIFYYAQSYYIPYLSVYEEFRWTMERVKVTEGKIFIEDINKKLSECLNSEMAPDIYFRIGETIFHYLIDEFQDTSPIQWNNLFPLIENSISQGGSLLAVGDIKQAIYGFRNTGYSIMKGVESENPFPSARYNVRELDTNYRSLHKIIDFNAKIFKEILAGNSKYREAAARTGLLAYKQKGKKDNDSDGYIEAVFYEKTRDNLYERQNILKTINELLERGYRYGDIAILTSRNEHVVNIAEWLGEHNIRFVSYSSLDIRRRKITGEIISFLKFLDSPLDDLSFATFILGDVFNEALKRDKREIKTEKFHDFFFRNRDNLPFYKAFQKDFGNIWKDYFEHLFKLAGCCPLYDLVTEMFSIFKVFKNAEEATFAKILEVIKNFEGTGDNNLRDFIEFTFDEYGDGSEWNINVPQGIDAVKIMTIHKAKGLGFPVVIVLLYGEQNRGKDIFVNTDEHGTSMLKISKNIAKSSALLDRLYNDKISNEQINRLNTLYVGLTRAKAEMYIIGVKGKYDHYNPSEFIPEKEYMPSPKPVKVHSETGMAAEKFSLYHHDRQIRSVRKSNETINTKDKERGNYIHKLLYFVEYIKDDLDIQLDRIIATVKKETALYYDDSVKRTVLEFITDETIRRYFLQEPGRIIKKEQEFSDTRGRLFRMDRVIIDKDYVTVIDYKTGSDKGREEQYESQVRDYMTILREIYPDRKIKGIIGFVDTRDAKIL